MRIIDFRCRKCAFLRNTSIWLAFLDIRLPSVFDPENNYLNTSFNHTAFLYNDNHLDLPCFNESNICYRLCYPKTKESLLERSTELHYFNTIHNKMSVFSAINSLQMQESSRHQKIPNAFVCSRIKNELFENEKFIECNSGEGNII